MGHKQTGLNIMDFAKAFDKVQNKRLLCKLDLFGLRSRGAHPYVNWLVARIQPVASAGQASDPVPVLSGVSQGSV